MTVLGSAGRIASATRVSGRDRDRVDGVHDHVTGPAADLEQRGHPAAGQAGGNAVPRRDDDADQVVAGTDGKGGWS
ncbi:hypothetical protein IL992_20790 [Microbispora sp. NEAU-D428]|uniref:hypothetical protein n=1 Tax=Microbispora sitophila TaxID=2771537 RepID=UPI001D028F17|nr:hypothetical protein [Microbispora sitophila]MBE3011620.1 hypothetical protein [Microbispora sitophila]